MLQKKRLKTRIDKNLVMILLTICILFGSALRLPLLDEDSLWVDEIITGTLARMDLSQLLHIVSNYDDHPPLIYLIAYITSRFHDSDFVLRLPTAFSSILIIPLMYVLGKRLWDARTGLIAAFFTAIWPTLIRYAQEARQYTILALFAVLSIYLLYISLSENRVKTWFFYGLVVLGMLYVHYFGFLLLIAHGVFVLIYMIFDLNRLIEYNNRSMRYKLMYFTITLFFVAILYLPWYSSIKIQSQRLFTYSENLSLSMIDVSKIQETLLPIIEQTFLFLADRNTHIMWGLIFFATIGSFYDLLNRNSKVVIFQLIVIFTPIVIFNLISSSHFFHPRYLFPLLLPVLLLAARGISCIAINTSLLLSSYKLKYLWVLTIITLISIYVMPTLKIYYHQEKEDWRGVTEYFAKHAKAGDRIICDGIFLNRGGDAERVRQGLDYYLRNPVAEIKAEPGLVDMLPSDQNAPGTAWGVLWWQDHLADTRSILTADFELHDFESIVIFRSKYPSGNLWTDTAAVLEAMLQLQPLSESLPDLDLALAQLYLRMGRNDLAIQHVLAVEAANVPLTENLMSVQQNLRNQLGLR